LGKLRRILLIALVLSFAFQSPVLYHQVAAGSTYPLALHFSIKIDATTNRWSVNVTNVGSTALFVIFSISPSPIIPAWTAENHTTLSPGKNTMMAMRCYDPFQNKPCSLVKNKIYSLVYDVWTPNSMYSFSLVANVSASNHRYVLNTYPFMALKFSTSLHSGTWNVSVTNLGTEEGKFQASMGYYGPNSPAWFQVGTPMHDLKSGGGYYVTNKAFTPRMSPGSGATVDVTGQFSGINGTCGWSATLDVEKLVTVK
jgi:hypothetical protein